MKHYILRNEDIMSHEIKELVTLVTKKENYSGSWGELRTMPSESRPIASNQICEYENRKVSYAKAT